VKYVVVWIPSTAAITTRQPYRHDARHRIIDGVLKWESMFSVVCQVPDLDTSIPEDGVEFGMKGVADQHKRGMIGSNNNRQHCMILES
jgi:hypothetical protein